MKTNQLFLLTGLAGVTLPYRFFLAGLASRTSPCLCPKGQKRGVGEAYEYSLYHVR